MLLDERILNNLSQDPERWAKVDLLFDKLLDEGNLTALIGEPDGLVREAAYSLWRHHLSAEEQEFLGSPLTINLRPMFEAGQTVLNRFEIRKALGSGGMGEVYLAYDRKLEELVALKTMQRLLSSSGTLRLRFIAEIQSARRVTHNNVCRIHELFEDGDLTFFSMEYVEGTLLSSWLKSKTNGKKYANAIALQLAEGLHAAHCKHVVHGDFKPGNIVIVPGDVPRAVIMDFGLARILSAVSPTSAEPDSLEGGTLEYMAPELSAGQAPSIQSDIYAFGKVGKQLMPGLGIWERCTQHERNQRPVSLDAVLSRLKGDSTRRYWIAIGATTGAVAASCALLITKELPPRLEAGARLMVNQLWSNTQNSKNAKFVRSLLLSALRQSPILHAVADEDLSKAVLSLSPKAEWPLKEGSLQQILKLQRLKYWIDGKFSKVNDRMSLELNVLRASDGQVVAQERFGDSPQIASIAARAAAWIRRMAGESDRSLVANPASVPEYTSSVPEALEKYYDAMEQYSLVHMTKARPLLEEAIRLDPAFAQAYNMLGLCLSSVHKYDEAYPAFERARQLSGKLPERERCWIEASYYAATQDRIHATQAANRLVNYYPGEPRFLRTLGQQYLRNGTPLEALEPLRKAIELSPGNEILPSVLSEALCEAGQFREALQVYEDTQARENKSAWMETGHGIALLGLGQYEDAKASFAKAPSSGNVPVLVAGAKVLAGEMDSALAELQQARAHARVDGKAVDEHKANEYLCGAYHLLDRSDLAQTHLAEMLTLPVYPLYALQWQCTASWAARLRNVDAFQTALLSSRELAARWPNDLTQSVQKHAEGLQASLQKSYEQSEQLLLESLGSAFTVWALFDLARLYLTVGRLDLANEYWGKMQDCEGIVLRNWFTGTVLMTWFNRALAAHQRGDRATARSFARQVIDPWGLKNRNTRHYQVATTLAY